MRVGLDIGSTTIKCVVLNDAEQIVYSTYERHYSHILEKGKELLHRAAQNYLPDGRAKLANTSCTKGTLQLSARPIPAEPEIASFALPSGR